MTAVERPLTETERARLLRAYGRERFPLRYVVGMLGITVLLSIPVWVLFALLARYLHSETWADSIWQTAGALLVGPGVLALIGIQAKLAHDPFADIRREIREGVCKLRHFRVARCAHLIESGDEASPDFLVELTDRKLLAVPSYEIAARETVRQNMTIAELPRSKVTVGLAFAGEPVPVSGRVETDSVWRNDDLPYSKPFAAKRLHAAASGRLNDGGWLQDET